MEKQSESQEELKSSKPLSKLVPRNRTIFLATVVILSMVHPTVLGYDALMTGGILNLPSYTSYFQLTPATIGLNNAGLWMGEILANLTVNQFLLDKMGRKKTILIGTSIVLVGVVLQSAAQHIAMFVVGRIVIGFGGTMTNVSAIVLVAELSPVARRGLFMGIAFSSFLIGGLISSGVTYALRNAPGTWSWRYPSIIMAAPQMIALTNLIFLPESPRWLLAVGREAAAWETLMITNSNEEGEVARIIDDFRGQNRAKITRKDFHPLLELFKTRINRHRVVLLFTVALVLEMSGVSVGTYYFAILLEQAGIKSSKQRLQANIAMSAWQLVCALVGSYTLDIVGRRRQALYAMTAMVALFLILGGLVKKYGSGADKAGSYGTIAVMFLFCGAYTTTFTPLTTVYASELFEFELRSAGTSMFQLFNSSFGLLSAFVLPIGMDSIGWRYYIVNGAYDVVFLPVIYYVWVETKGMDLEAVDEVFWRHRFHRSARRDPPNTPASSTSSSASSSSSASLVVPSLGSPKNSVY